MCVWTADINLSVASRTSPARRPWTQQSSTQQGAPHRGLETAARTRQCPRPSYSLALHQAWCWRHVTYTVAARSPAAANASNYSAWEYICDHGRGCPCTIEVSNDGAYGRRPRPRAAALFCGHGDLIRASVLRPTARRRVRRGRPVALTAAAAVTCGRLPWFLILGSYRTLRTDLPPTAAALRK
jgi:hypothetical protein